MRPAASVSSCSSVLCQINLASCLTSPATKQEALPLTAALPWPDKGWATGGPGECSLPICHNQLGPARPRSSISKCPPPDSKSRQPGLSAGFHAELYSLQGLGGRAHMLIHIMAGTRAAACWLVQAQQPRLAAPVEPPACRRPPHCCCCRCCRCAGRDHPWTTHHACPPPQPPPA
jgi:hypothetical protein